MDFFRSYLRRDDGDEERFENKACVNFLDDLLLSHKLLNSKQINVLAKV